MLKIYIRDMFGTMNNSWRTFYDKLTDYQVIIKSILWLILLVSFTYASLIRAVFRIDFSLIEEYRYILSSASYVFIHWGIVVMTIFDRLELDGRVLPNDYKLLVVMLVTLSLVVTIYFIALQPIGTLPSLLQNVWSIGFLHVMFFAGVAYLRYLVQFNKIPLVKPV